MSDATDTAESLLRDLYYKTHLLYDEFVEDGITGEIIDGWQSEEFEDILERIRTLLRIK